VSRLRGKSIELIVNLAMRGRPVSGERLRDELWGGEAIANDTWRSTASRARAALGTDAAGELRLPHADGGRLTLSAEIGCDLARFRALVAIADRSDDDTAVDALSAALALVEGRAFSDCGARYRWAEDDLHEIDRLIIDAAHRLTRLSLTREDTALATWATDRGLLANPEQLSLFDVRMQVCGAAGDADGVRRAFDGMRNALRRVDTVADLPDDADETYRAAMRAAADRRVSSG
jgi:hypothetical protein